MPSSRTPRPGQGQSFVFSLDHRPRATRASVPKVRSGCITCKRRHVKCDEAKPACQRCVKWQGFCDGYKPTESKSPKGDKRRRLSSSSQSERSDSAPASSGGELQDSQNELELRTQDNTPPDTGEKSQLEATYFNTWLSLAKNMDGGLFPARLFVETVPQMTHDEIPIRYAAIAVGALANALCPETPVPVSTPAKGVPHYNAAITYYGHALRLIRLQDESSAQSSVRVAVIACVLFTIFEVVHGSYEAAVNHINHGNLMIAGQLESIYKTGTFHFFLEDEVLQIFQRLTCLAWSTKFLDDSRLVPTICLAISSNFDVKNIPSRFSDLPEARKWLDMLQHRSLHFKQAVAERMDHTSGLSSFHLGTMPDLRGMQRQNISLLDQWKSAFWPRLSAADARYQEEGTPDGYLQSVSLQLQYTLLRISVESVSFLDCTAIQKATPEFGEILQLSEIILSKQAPPTDYSEIFTMDTGPTFALFITATKCLDYDMRNQAEMLMHQYPRRDAFWDSRKALEVILRQRTESADEDSAIDPLLAKIE